MHCSKQILSLPRFITIAGYCRNCSWRLNFICKHLYSAIMANKRKPLHTKVEKTFGKAQFSSRPSSKKWTQGFLVPKHLLSADFDRLFYLGPFVSWRLLPAIKHSYFYWLINWFSQEAKSSLENAALGVRAALWHSVHMRHLQMLYK